MLTKVEARNLRGALLSLPLEEVSGGYIVAGIDGLDPVKATLVSSGYAKQDGSQYQNARREERNIKLSIELQPDYVTTTVRDLRKQLYRFFMTKTEVDLRFFDSDGLTVDVSGRVETCETALFAKEPTVDISIMCFDPDFVALDEVEITGNTVADTGSETEPLTVAYEGDVETGIVFTLNVDRTITEFTIYNRPGDDILQQLDFEASLEAGDIVTISTVPGSKGATLTRDGIDSSILYGISPQSAWIEFKEGNNDLRIYAVGDPIPWSIKYTPRYGGL